MSKRSAAFSVKEFAKMVLQQTVFPAVYGLSCLVHPKVKPERVIFADAHHTELPASMELMYDYVKAQGKDVLTHFHDYTHGGMAASLKYSLQFMWLYPTVSQVYICDFFLPASSCRKRKKTKLIQLWHSCGLLKKIGYDTEDNVPGFYKGNVFRNYNLVTVSAEAVVPCLTSAMGQPEGIVRALGVSRTDLYFREDWKEACLREFKENYPEAIGKKVILWAPTFRGAASEPYIEGEEAIKKLSQALGEDWMILIKAHPHVDEDRKRKGKEPLSNCNIRTEELFPAVDLLITDYSSVLNEYFIFEKPFVLFSPDLQQYKKDRDFYVDYSRFTSFMTSDEKTLPAMVREATKLYESGQETAHFRSLREFHTGACDGSSTERIYLEVSGH